MTFREGDIVLLQPTKPVRWHVSTQGHCVINALSFRLKSIPHSWPAASRWPMRRHMPPDDILRPLFEFIVHRIGKRVEGYPPAFMSAMETMLAAYMAGEMDKSPTFPRTYPPAVQRVVHWAVRFMRQPSQKIGLPDLAGAAGVCPTHLCAMFRRHLKMTPLDFIRYLRLTRSLVDLRGGRKVNSVAREYGFADTTSYSRRFKQLFGKTPTQMKDAMARGYEPTLPPLPPM